MKFNQTQPYLKISLSAMNSERVAWHADSGIDAC